MSGIKIPAVERPNGKLYRPRAIKASLVGNEDEVTGIVVFGTHDVRFAEIRADELADEHQANYGVGISITGAGQKDWYGTRIAGSDDDGHLITVFITDPENGRACVVFPADEYEPQP